VSASNGKRNQRGARWSPSAAIVPDDGRDDGRRDPDDDAVQQVSLDATVGQHVLIPADAEAIPVGHTPVVSLKLKMTTTTIGR
jgi:hypothetical protein